jgi:hypothetical protein
MPRRPNYRFERAERDRAKEAKKEDKLKRQQERLSPRAGEGGDRSEAETQLDKG